MYGADNRALTPLPETSRGAFDAAFLESPASCRTTDP